MHKRTAGILLASTLTIGGGAIASAPANAADADNPVSNRLAEIKSALGGLVKDGTLTQDQADKVATTLDERLPKGGPHRERFGGPHLEDAAETLGLTVAELRTKLKDGKSLADVAKAEGVSTDKLVAAMVEHAEEHLATAVKNGKITQAEADKMKANLKDRITDRVNGVRPKRGPGDAGRPFGGTEKAPDASRVG